MTTSFTWQVTALSTTNEPFDSVVASVSGYLYGETDDGHNTTVPFSQELTKPMSSDLDEFIPYTDLTKEKVILWVLSCMSESTEKALKNKLETKLQDFVAPPVSQNPGLPWGVDVKTVIKVQ